MSKNLLVPDSSGNFVELDTHPTSYEGAESVASRSAVLEPHDKPTHDKVVNIFAMHDYIIYQKASGFRAPVRRDVAVKRLYAVMQQLMSEDGGQDKTESTYDEWLLENTAKACARSAELSHTPYPHGLLDKTLRSIRNEVKKSRTRLLKLQNPLQT